MDNNKEGQGKKTEHLDREAGEISAQELLTRASHELICVMRMSSFDTKILPELQLTKGNAELKSPFMPKDSAVSSTKPGQLKIEPGKVVDEVPLPIDPQMKDLLSKVKSINIEGGKVKLEGQGTTSFDAGGVKLNIAMRNPSFDIVPDDKNPNGIQIKNIKGMTVSGIPVPDLNLNIEKNKEGEAQLKLSIPRLMEKSVPLDKTTAEAAEKIITQMRELSKSPDKNNFAELAASLMGLNSKQGLGGAFDGIKSFKAKNDEVEIVREKASSIELGGLKVELGETLKAKAAKEGKDTAVKNIEGISAKLPLPDELAKNIGVDGKLPIKEVRIGEADKDGNRLVSIKTDSSIDDIKVKVDQNMKPCTDQRGNMTVEFTLKKDQDSLRLSMMFNPAKIEANGKTPDFQVDIKASSGDRGKLIQGLLGKQLDGPFKDMIDGVESIRKLGDRVSIKRAQTSSHDMNGNKLEAGKVISFKLIEDGKGAVKIDQIYGIKLKINTEIPGLVKKLGIDIPDNVPIGIKSIDLSRPDQRGNRRVSVSTDSPVKQVSGFVGPDMKPVLDANQKYKIGVALENPFDANKPLNFRLRIDQNNQLSMSTQELLELVTHLTAQAGGGVLKSTEEVIKNPFIPLPLVAPIIPLGAKMMRDSAPLAKGAASAAIGAGIDIFKGK